MSTPNHTNPSEVWHAPTPTAGFKRFRGLGPSTEVLVENLHKGTGELQWQFSTGWTTTASGGEDYTSTSGANALLRFKGTRAVIYAAKDVHHGEADVYVDGLIRTTIDCYATRRIADTAIFDSGDLVDGNHIIEVRVTGTKNANSTGTTVAIDHAKVLSTGLIAPPGGGSETPTNLVVIGDFDFTTMPDQIDYITTGKNYTAGHPWYLETGGRSELDIVGGRLVKPNKTEKYHRMWHKTLIYGLGKTLRVDMVVSTDIGPSSSNSHPGLKISPYYPPKNHPDPEDPHSVNDPGAASLQAFTGQTLRGRFEISNQVWEEYYRFSYKNGIPAVEDGYTNNTEEHIVTTFDFFTNTRVRTRIWNNGGTGTPKYEWDDYNYPIGCQYPFYLRIRTDDASWKCKRIKITLEDIVA